MKKVLLPVCLALFMVPVFAVSDVDTKMQKEQAKYQLKVEKIKKKQELQCIKHPEKCTANPVKETNLTLGTAQKNIKLGIRFS